MEVHDDPVAGPLERVRAEGVGEERREVPVVALGAPISLGVEDRQPGLAGRVEPAWGDPGEPPGRGNGRGTAPVEAQPARRAQETTVPNLNIAMLIGAAPAPRHASAKIL